MRERLARAGAVSLAGSAFAAASALLLTVLVGRGLGAAGTGIFYQSVGVFTIASAVLTLGTPSGLIRSMAERRALGLPGGGTRILTIALIPVALVSGVIGTCVAVLASPLAGLLGSPETTADLAEILRQLAPFLVVAATSSIPIVALRMMLGVTPYTIVQNVLQPFSRLALVAIALAMGAGATGTTIAWAASLPLMVILSCLLLLKPVLRDLRESRTSGGAPQETVRRFWSFSAARGVGTTIEFALDWSDVLIVAALRSPSEAGIYAVATRVVRAGQIVDRSVRVAASPRISELLVLERRDEARQLHTTVTRAMILLSWPFYLCLIVMGPTVMLMFGDEFEEGALVLAMLGFVMMIATAAGMLQSIMLMGGHSTWQVYNKSVALALSVGGNFLLVPRYGFYGAAVTWAGVVMVDTAIAAWLVHRRMGVRLEPAKLIPAIWPPLLVFGILGVGIRLVMGASGWSLGVYLGALGATYALWLWRSRYRLGIEPLWRAIPVPRWAVVYRNPTGRHAAEGKWDRTVRRRRRRSR